MDIFEKVDTYTRGTWGTLDVAVQWLGGDEIEIDGVGVGCNALGYNISDDVNVSMLNSDEYKFFVFFGHRENEEGILVKDFPSLLMLIRELHPLIELRNAKKLLDMQIEKHAWEKRDREES